MKRIQILSAGLVMMAAACGGPPRDETTVSFLDELRSAPGARLEGTVTQTNLVADQDGQAAATDPHLLNAWGLAFNPKGPAWISANGNGTSQVYDATGARRLEVTIPPPAGGEPPSAPTGQVFNPSSSSAFLGDVFIFVTEDGTVAGWQPADAGNAVLRADNSPDEAIYKGVTIATPFTGHGQPRLYAANFHAGTVDVFDDHYGPVTSPGRFRDEALPVGYAPFNVFGVGPFVLVTYAQQDENKEDDVSGPGHGFVDVFTAEGFFFQRLISGGALNSPWGVVFAPDRDGASIDLAIGNFGDGRINVYDLSLRGLRVDARFEGSLGDATGAPLVIDGLWALAFGPGTGGFAADQLYFTAGPNGEKNGLFGKLVFSGPRR